MIIHTTMLGLQKTSHNSRCSVVNTITRKLPLLGWGDTGDCGLLVVLLGKGEPPDEG